MLVTEIGGFQERNSTSEESASEFSFLYMIYSWEWTKQSDEEISQVEGSCVFESPLAYIHSQTFHSQARAPLCHMYTDPRLCHQRTGIEVSPSLPPLPYELMCTKTPGMSMAKESCLTWIKTHFGESQLTLPWVIQGILFYIHFWITHSGKRFLLWLQSFAKPKMLNLCDLSLYISFSHPLIFFLSNVLRFCSICRQFFFLPASPFNSATGK